MDSKQMILRTRVVQYYSSHSKKATVQHFTSEGYSKRSVYGILANCETRQTVIRKVGSGRPAKIMTKRRKTWLKRATNNRADVSSTQLGRKLRCDLGYVRKTILQMGIRYYKKQLAPAYTRLQIDAVKRCCRWMNKRYRQHFFILDDEKYFSLSGPSSGSYRTDNNR